MKYLFIIFSSIYLIGCSSLHIQSTSLDAATIVVQNTRIVDGEKYRPYVAINIDGKRVSRTQENYERDPQSCYVEALITPGFHEIKIEVTAYNGERAKYEHETIGVELTASSKYELSVQVPEQVSTTIKADSWAEINMRQVDSEREILNKKIVLKDNALRSIASSEDQKEITDGIIQGIIIDSAQ